MAVVTLAPAHTTSRKLMTLLRKLVEATKKRGRLPLFRKRNPRGILGLITQEVKTIHMDFGKLICGGR